MDSETITPEIEEAFDPNTRGWAANMDEPGVLLGRCGRGPAMLEQIKAVVGDAVIDELHVCAPYFDERAEALTSLAGQLGSPSTTVFVQSHRTNLLQAAARALDSTFTLRAASFQHREEANGEERVRDALLHAKFYAVRQADLVTVFFGSANCSRAALTVPGSGGNAELMAHATMPAPEFEKAFLAELVVDDVEPVLAADAKDEEAPSETGGFLHVTAARMEAGLLRVAFESDESSQLSHADIDGSVFNPDEVGMEWALFKTSGNPRTVVLVGTCRGATIQSQLHWIDDERALRSSARARSLAESIHSRVRSDRWGIGAWTHVLSELFKHLKYIPKVGPRRRSTARGDDGGAGGPVEFEWDDVFSDTYGLPAVIGLAPRFSFALDDRVASLRTMLLRWYGIVQPEHDETAPTGDDDSAKPEMIPSQEGDGGDKMVELPRAVRRSELTMTSEKEKKKALKLVRQVAAKLGEPDFLSERQPELLAADLKVAAVLLRVGLAAEWLTQQEFFDTTLAIWLPLFFNATGSENTGWLEQRYLTASDQQGFARSISSVELAAALGCWALSVPAKATSADHALFDLACTLGVARLPWLWQTGGNRRIAKEIAAMIAATSQGDDVDWRKLERRWLTLIRRGYALNQLQKAVADVGFGELRGRIKQRRVVAGELLWQEPAGFCVATEDCDRVKDKTGTVRVLQQERATKKYLAPYLMPVAGLLDENVLADTVIRSKARKELLSMIEELRLRLSV